MHTTLYPRIFYSSGLWHSVIYTISRPEDVFFWVMAPCNVHNVTFQNIIFFWDVALFNLQIVTPRRYILPE